MDEPVNAKTNAQDGSQHAQEREAGMDPASRLLAAERRLELARLALRGSMERLGALRRAALAGDHDQEALDEAVFACREAEARVRAARTDVERAQARAFGAAAGEAAVSGTSDDRPFGSAQGRLTTDDRQAEPAPEPLEVTPRLLFARWLVQTGRLSEQVAA